MTFVSDNNLLRLVSEQIKIDIIDSYISYLQSCLYKDFLQSDKLNDSKNTMFLRNWLTIKWLTYYLLR